MIPALAGRPLARDGALFWEHIGNRALRAGSWKLVAQGERGAWELYDLETDRGEQRDLAGEQPERVDSMRRLFRDWHAEGKANRPRMMPAEEQTRAILIGLGYVGEDD